jgi:hypothetical protein
LTLVYHFKDINIIKKVIIPGVINMAMQIRRGTNAERQLMIPLQGELIFTTDTKKLYVGDGTTLGGVIVDTTGSGGEPDGNTTYTISAGTTTGGANLTLTGSDSSIDNVKLEAGANVTVTRTDANTITIASSGSGSGAATLDELTDVVISDPTTGQVLKFDGTNWVNDTDEAGSGGGAAALDDLTDVSLSLGDLAEGQVLKYNGTNWVNLPEDPAFISIDELTDVALNPDTLAEGQVLKYDGTVWYNADDTTPSVSSLDDIDDVVIDALTVATGQVLSYDGTNWVNESLSTTALNDITDVIITGTPIDGQVLKYNGTNWVNQSEDAVSVALEVLTDVALNPDTLVEGQVLKYDGTVWYNATDENTAPLSLLDDFEDVVIDAVTLEPGQALKWNGAIWTNQDDSFGEAGGAETLDELADVAIDFPELTLGQILAFNGSQWVNTDPVVQDPYAINDLTDVIITGTPTTGQIISFDGINWINDTLNIEDMSDVVFTGFPAPDQILAFDGFVWTNINPSPPGIESLIADLIPELGGDLNLNEFDIIGTGNIDITGTVTATTLNGPLNVGDVILDSTGITSPNQFNLGTRFEPLDPQLVLSQNLKIRQLMDPAGGSGFIKIFQSRGTFSEPLPPEPGDEMGGIILLGVNPDLTPANSAIIGAFVDPTAIPGGEFIKSQIILSAATDTSQDPDDAFILDSAGVATSNAFVANKYMQLPVYADDAARSTAIPTPAKGMMVFMTSGTAPTVTNKSVVYDGSAWVALH